MKLIIIGAGISGLTLAAACQQIGMEVKVYDKAKQLENIGGGVLLWPHGQRFLDWLGLSQCLNAHQIKINACHLYGSQNQKIFHEDCASLFNLLGGSILPIDRSILQKELYDQLSENTVILNKCCTQITSTQEQATAYFSDGTEESADLIIGADGLYSVARQYVNPDADLQYTGYCWFGGVTHQQYAPGFPVNECVTFASLSKMFIVWPTQGQRLMWYVPVKMPLNQYIINDSDKLHEVCKDWHPDITSVISAPKSAQSFYLPIFTALPPQQITHKRVVLIGDAAHTLGPILGQGASQAIEDAYLLFNCLINIHDELSEVLLHYQNLRLDKYKKLAKLENESVEVMINDDEKMLLEFETQAKEMSLAEMYERLIPLVDEEACLQLAKATTEITEDQSVALD